MHDLVLLPPAPTLAAFCAAGLAVALTPGADMTFAAVSGARHGRKAGLAAALGTFIGCLAHILFAVVGLSALVAASQTAFTVLKWAGAAYLLYLAWGLVRSGGGGADAATPSAAPPSLGRVVRAAALINLLNPKVGIFFLAFLPQFLTPAAGPVWPQVLTLGLLFNAGGLVVNAGVGVAGGAAARRFGRAPLLARGARWLAATLLGGLALRLALTERR